jgi:hypothetical protein
MKYIDRVYGESEINEPVILELIGSPSLLRLKGVDQAGYRALWVKPDAEIGEGDHSRFAHSLGVYLLLKKYGAPLEEQIAGLIHDVSHTAFSHCIDYVLAGTSGKNQDYQDSSFERYVKNSEIPLILKRYGFDPAYVMDDANFPLKEKLLPDLCADRIDYSLKTAVIFDELNEDDAQAILSDLLVENGLWYFRNFESAARFAELFRMLNNNYYACFLSAVMFRAIGDCLKYAMEHKYISMQDFYTTDDVIIEKMKQYVSEDRQLAVFWDRMNGKVKAVPGGNISTFVKSRVVDPFFKKEGRLQRVSTVDKSWARILKEETKPREYFVSFEQ